MNTSDSTYHELEIRLLNKEIEAIDVMLEFYCYIRSQILHRDKFLTLNKQKKSSFIASRRTQARPTESTLARIFKFPFLF